ncbi:unnamed protein product [Durusdinium trenchii]|uniref:Right handed beta helix domain-containing protein n=1 Tax=Durusdinium trenchii TaxID=1381693 RepID=A0ABP0N4C5_9DINO
MAGTREDANALYRAGNLEGACAVYEELVAQAGGDGEELAKLHNNLSVCFKGLGNLNAALQHAESCLELNPEHGLCHLRAFMLSENMSHLEAAAALLGHKHSEVRPLLSKLPDAVHLLKTNEDVAQLALELEVGSRQDIKHSLLGVLCPGSYQVNFPLVAAGRRVKLLGLGKVLLVKARPEANLGISCEGGELVVETISMQEGSHAPVMGLLAAGDRSSIVTLQGCILKGSGGVTVVEGRLQARFCEFHDMTNMAVEMRSAGHVELLNCRFCGCCRGIQAAARTGEIVIRRCEFQATKKEAVQLDGCRPAASARAVDDKGHATRQKLQVANVPRDQQIAQQYMQQVSQQTRESLRKDKADVPPLRVQLHSNSFTETGWQAVSCGDGVHAELFACHIMQTRATEQMIQQEIGSQLQAQGLPVKMVKQLIQERDSHIRQGSC